jgi:uncharacterized membrane protein
MPGSVVMIVIAVLVGMVLGGVLSGLFGALAGALLGYGTWSILSLSKRVSLLENEVRELSRKAEPLPGRVSETPRAAPSVSEYVPRTTQPEPALSVSLEAEKSARQATEKAVIPEWSPEWTASAPTASTTPLTKEQVIPEERRTPVREFMESTNRFLSGGSLLVKVGVIVLFFGISFLVKYAADHSLFPIELRLITAALAGIALLGIGWRLRSGRPVYAHVLQGGGVGVLYLTTFAAFRLYGLIPPFFAFSVLVAVAVLSAFLAVLQDSRALAVLGVSGGFLAPILASTGSGSHVFLFSYYTLLNLGIAGIAWFRAWRVLNLLGFAFTFVIGLSWGWRYYRPEHFTTTEPFLILFFLIYTFIAVLFALRQPPNLKGYLDGTLIFGTPIAAFSLQAMLVEPYHFGLAWSALALGLFYLPLAWLLYVKRPVFMRTVTEAFFAFGVVFATMAIPFALDNRWTSAVWALEGAAILWAGLRQHRRLPRAFGILLQFGAGISFLADLHGSTGSIPVLNDFFLGCALIALTGIFSANRLHRHRESVSIWESVFGNVLLVWGLLWWFGGGLGEIDRHGGEECRMGIVLVFLSISCWICDLLERRLAWPVMAWPALALLPMLIFCGVYMVAQDLHPLEEGGLAGWPPAFAAYYMILYRHDELKSEILHLLHGGTLWLATGLITLEMGWRLEHWIAGSAVWPLTARGLVPALAVLLVATQVQRLSWPLARHNISYLTLGVGPVALFAWLWIWFSNITSPGDSDPLSYLPFLNPLDLTIGCVIVALAAWGQRLRSTIPDIASKPYIRKTVASLLAATVFAWLNGVLVRTVHHWGEVPFSGSSLYHSVLLQTALSIFWSLLALCAMVAATRKGLRHVWLAGAGLLAAVVVKLFLVDLSGTGTIARIVSFVGVGLLLLVIGYFSPVPPRGQRGDLP